MVTNEKSILVPRRLLEGIKEYMEWGKSRVDPRPLSEWMDEVLAKPDEPTPGRCPTCSRWLEMRCAVCGPVESSDEPTAKHCGYCGQSAQEARIGCPLKDDGPILCQLGDRGYGSTD